MYKAKAVNEKEVLSEFVKLSKERKKEVADFIGVCGFGRFQPGL